MTNSNLSSSNVSDSNIKDANISNSTLKDNNITTSNVSESNVSTSNVTSSNLSDSNVTSSNITQSNISGGQFENNTINNANISGLANVSGGTLNNTNITNATINGFNITSDFLKDNNVTNSNITNSEVVKNVSMKGNNITDAKVIENSTFNGTNIIGSPDNATKVSNITVAGGVVCGVNANSSQFIGGVTCDSNVSNSNITLNNVSNSNLTNSSIIGAVVTNNSTINSSNITQSAVKDSNITNSNVTNVKLDNVTITSSNLTAKKNTPGQNVSVTDKDLVINDVTIKDSNLTLAHATGNASANVTLSNMGNLHIENTNLTLSTAEKGNSFVNLSFDKLTIDNDVVGSKSESGNATAIIHAKGDGSNSTGGINGNFVGSVTNSGNANTSIILEKNTTINGNVTGSNSTSGNATTTLSVTNGAELKGNVVGAASQTGNAVTNITLESAANIAGNVTGSVTSQGNATAVITAGGDASDKGVINGSVVGAQTQSGSANATITLDHLVQVGGNVTGATSTNGTANANINVSGAAHIAGNVTGASSANGSATANINVSGIASVGGDVVGANSANGTASANISASNAQVNGSVVGANATGDATGAVTITSNDGNKSVIKGNVTGAHSTGGEVSGFVNLSRVDVGGDVVAASSNDKNASGKVVLGEGVSVGGNVYASKTSKANTTGGVIDINGADLTVKGDIYGGYIDNVYGSNNEFATNNTININAAVNLHNSTLYGGANKFPQAGNAFSGNTLNVYTAGASVKDIANFEFINFYLPKNVTNSSAPLLNLTGSGKTDLSKTFFGVGAAQDAKAAGKIDVLEDENVREVTITLIQKDNGELVLGDLGRADRLNTSELKSLSTKYDYNYALSNGNSSSKLMLTVVKGMAEEQKVLYESSVASVAPVIRSHEPIHDMLENMVPNADLTTSDIMSGNIESYNLKTYTGSYIINKGMSAALGFGRTTENELYYGAFLDLGYSDYDTYNDFNGKEVKGQGKSRYFGGGLFAKWFFGSELNNYIHFTGRVGQSKSEYDTNVDSGSYNKAAVVENFTLNRFYYGATLEIGHKFDNVWEDGALEVYARGAFTNVAKADGVQIGSDKFDIATIDSLIARGGLRYLEKFSKTWTGFIDIAFEREFDGEADGRSSGFTESFAQSYLAPSLKGNSGVAAVGVTYETNGRQGFVVNIKVQGSAGKNRGYGGGFDVQYKF